MYEYLGIRADPASFGRREAAFHGYINRVLAERHRRDGLIPGELIPCAFVSGSIPELPMLKKSVPTKITTFFGALVRSSQIRGGPHE